MDLKGSKKFPFMNSMRYMNYMTKIPSNHLDNVMDLRSFKEEEELPCMSMRKTREDQNFTEEGVKMAHKGRVLS